MPKQHSMSCEYPEGCSCGASEHNALEEKLTREWHRGYACAVAQILQAHGDEQVARDVMRCGGRDLLKHADPEDLEIIKQHRLETR